MPHTPAMIQEVHRREARRSLGLASNETLTLVLPRPGVRLDVWRLVFDMSILHAAGVLSHVMVQRSRVARHAQAGHWLRRAGSHVRLLLTPGPVDAWLSAADAVLIDREPDGPAPELEVEAAWAGLRVIVTPLAPWPIAPTNDLTVQLRAATILDGLTGRRGHTRHALNETAAAAPSARPIA